MNHIRDIRPDSTFESYEPINEEQERARAALQDLASKLSESAPDGTQLNLSRFRKGALLVLSGTVGTGKTHLLESFANTLINNRPDLANSMFFSCGDFLGTFSTQKFVPATVDNKSIILIDDVFSNRKTVDDLDHIDVQSISSLMTFLNEDRRLCVMTTNFPFTLGIGGQIKKYDPVGRISSRCAELLATAGEFDTSGPDYREVKAQIARQSGRRFDLL
jgi:DNA replication protein DnaC